MSLVVAIKDGDRVALGADKQVSFGETKEHNMTKIWEVDELPGAIMGGVGTVRASQIVQHSSIIDKNILQEFNTSFVITNIVPSILCALEANGINCTKPDTDMKMMPNAFIFAYADRAWMIWQDLSVTEIEDFIVIGSGADVARGALFATADQNPFKRIVTSINAAAEHTLYVDDGIDLLITGSHRNDAKQIAAAFKINLAELLGIPEEPEVPKKPEKKKSKAKKDSKPEEETKTNKKKKAKVEQDS